MVYDHASPCRGSSRLIALHRGYSRPIAVQTCATHHLGHHKTPPTPGAGQTALQTTSKKSKTSCVCKVCAILQVFAGFCISRPMQNNPAAVLVPSHVRKVAEGAGSLR